MPGSIFSCQTWYPGRPWDAAVGCCSGMQAGWKDGWGLRVGLHLSAPENQSFCRSLGTQSDIWTGLSRDRNTQSCSLQRLWQKQEIVCHFKKIKKASRTSSVFSKHIIQANNCHGSYCYYCKIKFGKSQPGLDFTTDCKVFYSFSVARSWLAS